MIRHSFSSRFLYEATDTLWSRFLVSQFATLTPECKINNLPIREAEPASAELNRFKSALKVLPLYR
jgi:hypothetical protein